MEKKYKQIDFDIEAAKKIQSGEIEGKIVTREGYNARIMCFDALGKYPLLVLVKEDDAEEGAETYNASGKAWAGEVEHSDDLVIEIPVEEPERKFECFENVLFRTEHTPWTPGIFLDYTRSEEFPYWVSGHLAQQCIPYNEQTEHLVGTTDNLEEEE